MHSGSPFHHFPSKQAMLLAVMEEGLAEGLRRSEAVLALRLPLAEKFRRLVRSHLGTIHDKGHDFIPVLLYDWRSLTPANRRRVIALRDRYDALWDRMLEELAREGLIAGDPQVARLFVLGAINWSAKWYRPGGRLSVDELAAQAAKLLLR
jgi:AcrR family transcriptional regulator